MLLCFFKQKTAYEMRISDWSSDVCSSDLHDNEFNIYPEEPQTLWSSLGGGAWLYGQMYRKDANPEKLAGKTQGFYQGRRLTYAGVTDSPQIGRASRRERVCQDV